MLNTSPALREGEGRAREAERHRGERGKESDKGDQAWEKRSCQFQFSRKSFWSHDHVGVPILMLCCCVVMDMISPAEQSVQHLFSDGGPHGAHPDRKQLSVSGDRGQLIGTAARRNDAACLLHMMLHVFYTWCTATTKFFDVAFKIIKIMYVCLPQLCVILYYRLWRSSGSDHQRVLSQVWQLSLAEGSHLSPSKGPISSFISHLDKVQLGRRAVELVDWGVGWFFCVIGQCLYAVNQLWEKVFCDWFILGTNSCYSPFKKGNICSSEERG